MQNRFEQQTSKDVGVLMATCLWCPTSAEKQGLLHDAKFDHFLEVPYFCLDPWKL